MKTLDEVIFEAPYTQTPWEADALHYLKEYKEFLSQMKLPEAKPRIEPISWDELKQMEGKTVRLVYWGGRTLVKIDTTDNDNLIVVSDEKNPYISLYSDKQNVTWNAYRQEQK